MSVGNQYSVAYSSGTVSQGYMFLDLTGPLVLTIANYDMNANLCQPVNGVFTEYVPGPQTVALNVYSLANQLIATFWIDISSATAPSVDATQYTITDYVMRDGTTWDPDMIVYIIIGFFRSDPQPGPTGPAGVNGAPGDAGAVGPTGAVRSMGAVSLRASSFSPQAVPDSSATAVILDAVDLGTTNSGDLTASTTTGLVTCVATGVYQVTGQVNWAATIAPGKYQLSVLVNGTPSLSVNTGVSATLTSDNGQSISSLVEVSVADTTVGLSVLQDSGSAQALLASGTQTSYLSVVRLS